MYYYLDFYQPLFHFPPYNTPSYVYIPPASDSIPQNALPKDKMEKTFPVVAQPKLNPKIQQDQKMTVQRRTFNVNKKLHIISKKSKIKKINFVDKRNIIPNNINHVLAFVQRKSKSEKLIEKIVTKQKKQQSYNVKGFYSYQSFVKNKLSVHVNTRALEIATTHLDYETLVFKRDQQLFYNKVARIAIKYYLNNIAPVVTLQSQRLKNTCKEDHFKVQRFLLSLLESLSYEESQNEEIESKVA